MVHNLIGFFKSTLTVPKIKDLVTTPNQKYENMFNVMSSKSNTLDQEDDVYYGGDGETSSTNKNANTNKNMKDELKNFLKQQMNSTTSQPSTTDISFLDGINSGIGSFSPLQGNYSNY